MAHVLKDSMNHYAIEVSRGPKHVNCIMRINGEVEYKKLPLTKMISDHEYHTNDGQHQFDRRWERVLHGDPNLPDPKHERLTAELKDLHHVINSFLSGMLPVTDKARRLLERLRLDPTATSAPQPTNDNEDNAMTTKKAKKAKAKKERGETIGAVIRGCLKQNMGTDETLDHVKKAFPKAHTTKNSVAFYRSKMKAEGSLPKG